MSPTGGFRGADALVRALEAAGTRRIFTLAGKHIMPAFGAAFDSSTELIHTRHGASTVHMADAYARISGEVGIALVTAGPGHANVVSALYTAQMTGIIAGYIDPAHTAGDAVPPCRVVLLPSLDTDALVQTAGTG
jgi:glyoxylate carboligase